MLCQAFKYYRALCPPNAPQNAFYLQPSTTPTETCWYSTRLLGHTKFGSTVSRFYSNVGIGGFRTNHSLCASAGHRSVEGAQSYKRNSDTQRKELSDILNASKNIPLTPVFSSKQLIKSETHASSQPYQVFKNCTVNFYTGQQQQTACNTAPGSALKQRLAVIYDSSDSDSE